MCVCARARARALLPRAGSIWHRRSKSSPWGTVECKMGRCTHTVPACNRTTVSYSAGAQPCGVDLHLAVELPPSDSAAFAPAREKQEFAEPQRSSETSVGSSSFGSDDAAVVKHSASQPLLT